DRHEMADIEHRKPVYGGGLRTHPNWRWHRSGILSRVEPIGFPTRGVGEKRGEICNL
ncbi:MAG: hypothetical protein RL540_1778, partial [Actinomycetota bacterium]